MTQASQILENKQLKLVETILPRINKKAAVLFINKKLGNPWLYLRLFVVCSVGWMMSHDFGLQVNHSFIISCSVKLFTSSTQLKNDKGQTSGHCLNRWGLPNSSMFWQWYILVVPPWVVSLSLSFSLPATLAGLCLRNGARAGVFKQRVSLKKFSSNNAFNLPGRSTLPASRARRGPWPRNWEPFLSNSSGAMF